MSITNNYYDNDIFYFENNINKFNYLNNKQNENENKITSNSINFNIFKTNKLRTNSPYVHGNSMIGVAKENFIKKLENQKRILGNKNLIFNTNTNIQKNFNNFN